MGEVFAAYDRKLDRKVALKFLLRPSDDDRLRMMREAHAMARLSHPNVVAVFDNGSVDGRLFLSMEFVAGTTLKEWQESGQRSWREVLRAYIEAGGGLAAAHAAGLVHRDFKPTNALVDASGRVRVTDFGVARSARGQTPPREQTRDSTPSSSRRNGMLDEPLTMEGCVVGTPGYMPPEQWRAETVDARGDQFSFCVALYEALYGAKPYPGEHMATRYASMMRGEIDDPPRGSSVPPRVRRTLLRGLSFRPEDRYPDMGALLDDLARDPTRWRWRAAAAVAGLVIVASTAVGVGRASAARQSQLCTGADVESDAFWNDVTRSDVRSGLLSTGVPYAQDTWERTRKNIDAYMTGWRASYRETCEATSIRGEQTEAVMTARMACLEQRRDEVAALARVLTRADTAVVAKAVEASGALTAIDTCKDVTSLMAIPPLPTDAEKRAEVEAVRRTLAEANANVIAGRESAAREQAVPLVARARATGHVPTLALALGIACTAQSHAGAFPRRAPLLQRGDTPGRRRTR
jgi:hypothetical protein